MLSLSHDNDVLNSARYFHVLFLCYCASARNAITRASLIQMWLLSVCACASDRKWVWLKFFRLRIYICILLPDKPYIYPWENTAYTCVPFRCADPTHS